MTFTTGGGGGGSSLVPAGGALSFPAGAQSQVRIAWETPRGELDRDRLAFADTPAGALSPTQAITLSNRAASSRLEVPDASVDSDDFLVTSSSCRSVAPGASCVVKVRFFPAGARRGGGHADAVRQRPRADRRAVRPRTGAGDHDRAGARRRAEDRA